MAALGRRRGSKDLSLTEQEIISSVYDFFVEEKRRRQKIHGNEPARRAGEACGVSERTVYNARKAVEEAHESATGPLTAGTARTSRGRKAIHVDEFTRAAVRMEVANIFARKEVPTSEKVLQACTENIVDFPQMSKTTLWKLMRSIGFRYKVRNNKRQLYERQAVIASRADYLRQVRAYRAAGRPIVYLDETWCNQHHSLKRAWTSGDVAPADAPSGKGKRLIILHAGSSEGWIPGAELVFVGKKGSGDYHDEMNAAHFEDWWKNQLLPNLPPDAVIVIDNAPYHNRRTPESVCPTSNTRKADMISWLTGKSIQFDPTMLKAQFYQLIKLHKPKPVYVVDELAKSQGCAVLRSPVGHCELNPIELIWAEVKGRVVRRNKTYRMKDVHSLVCASLAEVTRESWAKVVQHVIEKVEDKYWVADALQEELVEDLVIEIGGDSDDSSDSDSSGEDTDIDVDSSDSDVSLA